jgi:hypothetical protein
MLRNHLIWLRARCARCEAPLLLRAQPAAKFNGELRRFFCKLNGEPKTRAAVFAN